MADAEKQFDEDDAVCASCIEDAALREIVQSEGTKEVCTVCGEENVAVSIKQLAEIIDPYIREHYRPGPYVRRWGEGDDDGYWEEQEGEDLDFILQEITGQYFDFQDTLVQSLIDNDPADVSDGDEPFYEDTTNYVETPVYVGDLYEEWNAISDELRTRRRFFSDRARKFLDWLFEGIEELWFPESKGADDFTPYSERTKLHVVHSWEAKTAVFRARRADTNEDYTRILLKPAVELSPPPSRNARAGRMNPEGVSIFYGALDGPTCLAEMRSSIGGYTVLGCFETTKQLRILDFSRLDKAHSGGKALSYFQIGFNEEVSRRKFRRNLHRLISRPVVPGHEDEYLITQVLAEYLAHVRKDSFDGLLFSSVQRDEGINVVLFSKHHDGDNVLGTFTLSYIKESAKLYRTRRIDYDIPEIRFGVDESKVYLLHDYDEDDDD